MTPLTIQLTPQSQTDPWFAADFPALPDLPRHMLPAYGNLNQFNLLVEGPDSASEPVSGALVQAQTQIGTSAVGSTKVVGSAGFARSGLTNSQGIVSFSPVRQRAGGARLFGRRDPARQLSLCDDLRLCRGDRRRQHRQHRLGPTQPPILLPLRPVVAGTVTDSHGYPVANVNVTATPGPTPTCGSAPPSAGSTTTAANGTFFLPLNPGTYQLDYDPPSGAAAPRLTELTAVVPPNVAQLSHSSRCRRALSSSGAWSQATRRRCRRRPFGFSSRAAPPTTAPPPLPGSGRRR